jgi:hypothetical protein
MKTKMNRSEKLFNKLLKEAYDAEPDPEQIARANAYRAEWDTLRAQLHPCECGATNTDLHFQCAQFCSAAWVWCSKCGFGTPARHEEAWPNGKPLLWRSVEHGGDARPLAVAAWNDLMDARRSK